MFFLQPFGLRRSMLWTVIAIHHCPGRHVVATWMLSGTPARKTSNNSERRFFTTKTKPGEHRKMHLEVQVFRNISLWSCKIKLPPLGDIFVSKVKKLIEYRADPLLEPGLSLINGWGEGSNPAIPEVSHVLSTSKDINSKEWTPHFLHETVAGKSVFYFAGSFVSRLTLQFVGPGKRSYGFVQVVSCNSLKHQVLWC